MNITFPTSLPRVLVVGTVGLLAMGAGISSAADTARLASRSVPVIPTVTGMDGVVAEGNVRLVFPSSWTARTGKASLTLRNRRTAECGYTVTVKTDYVVFDRGSAATALATQLAPATGPYLVDAGTRGSMAWRVTRVRDTQRTRILAVRIAPSAVTAGRDHPLPAGKQFFLRTTATAVDGANDECHTGTYRDSLGPSIGDAFALQKGRAFITGA
jgi:hypothetical protein